MALVPALAQVPTDAVRQFVLSQLGRVDGATHVEVEVGQADSRLQLAACAHAEPFLHPGARLWGHGFVGLHCTSGANWSISVPVDVRIYGPGLRAVHKVPAGASVGQSDVKLEQIEWTHETQSPVVGLQQLEGRVTTRTLEPGQLISLSALREPPAVDPGDSVKVVGVGQGFSIMTEAIALASAGAGQPVRVRTESGKILTGTARAGRIVEVVF